MRSVTGIVVIVALGLAAAWVIGFYPTLFQGSAVYDDEQSGFDKQMVIKFSHIVAENTPKGLAAQEFARLAQEKTQGRVKIEVYPNSVLYTEVDEIEALQKGHIQMIAPSFPNMSEILPEWMALDLPYAFLTDEAVQEAFDGKIGRILFDQLEQVNMVGLAYWSNGFKQITSSKGPLVHPGDFKNLRFRTMRSKLIDAEFHQFHVKTTQMPFNDVYRAMENGSVDGGENTISNIYTKKIFQVQQYMTISNHGYLGYAVLMNKSYWQRLSPDLQAALREAITEATLWASSMAKQLNEQQLAQINKEASINIYTLKPEERTEWMRAWEPIYRQFAPIIGQELMEEIRRLQHKYRN